MFNWLSFFNLVTVVFIYLTLNLFTSCYCAMLAPTIAVCITKSLMTTFSWRVAVWAETTLLVFQGLRVQFCSTPWPLHTVVVGVWEDDLSPFASCELRPAILVCQCACWRRCWDVWPTHSTPSCQRELRHPEGEEEGENRRNINQQIKI